MPQVQLGQIVQQITLERDAHRQQAEQLQKEMAQLEETLENKTAEFHHHVGAMRAKEETLNSIQRLAQESAAPDSDPNAHSDQ